MTPKIKIAFPTVKQVEKGLAAKVKKSKKTSCHYSRCARMGKTITMKAKHGRVECNFAKCTKDATKASGRCDKCEVDRIAYEQRKNERENRRVTKGSKRGAVYDEDMETTLLDMLQAGYTVGKR